MELKIIFHDVNMSDLKSKKQSEHTQNFIQFEPILVILLDLCGGTEGRGLHGSGGRTEDLLEGLLHERICSHVGHQLGFSLFNCN